MTEQTAAEVQEEVTRIYWLALNRIVSEGRQSREMRIARQALKDATYVRMSGPIVDRHGVVLD